MAAAPIEEPDHEPVVAEPGPVRADRGDDKRPGWVVTRPDGDVPVVVAAGELDLLGAERLAEVLWPRLVAAVWTVVVDLGAVSFLSVAGLDLLHQAGLQAQARGVSLRLVVTSREVARAVTVAGLAQVLVCYASADEALCDPDPGSARPLP